MLSRRQCSLAVLAASLLPGLAPFAAAQDAFPKKPINLVIGFPPGGAIDTIGRIVAQNLTQKLGQPVVVQNRPGAGGNIAQQLVYQSEPDGSTLLLGSIGSLVINPQLMKLAYNPRDMAPVSLAASFPTILVVKSDLGVRTLQDFIALARKDPKRVSFASGGAGTASHLAGEMFNQRTGLDILHVPFQGGAPALTALMGGQVTAYYATPSSAQPFLEARQVIAIATTGLERAGELPAVPTIAESGFKGFNATNWYAFMLPAKTPSTLVKRWNAELVAVLSAPDVIAAFAQHGLVPKPSTPEELASFMDSESAAWAKVIAARNINLK
ncbi:MAG: tripartite tricarboxylate transporter substrate binding protein [Ramlibacter sp.]|nr:tripartite tricarboxylate transporter substrate binding protein [Ramlibacter sp.]